MPTSLTLNGWSGPRVTGLLVGAAMLAVAALAVRLFYAANFPDTIYAGATGGLASFFDCGPAAFAPTAQIGGVPLGYVGVTVGALAVLGALFPSEAMERTNLFLAAPNAVAAFALALGSLSVSRSLCLFYAAYALLSLAGLGVYWRWAVGREVPGAPARFLRPSAGVLAAFVVVAGSGAFGMARLTEAKRVAQTGGEAARVVREFLALPRVPWPSVLSPYWSVRSTARFEDAPIQVVEYADFLCSDCLLAYRQMQVLRREFAGKLNVVFQPFPLETRCNGVVPKDKHPGACDAIAIAFAVGPERFPAIHDEIFEHFRRAKQADWREALARRYGVPGAAADTALLSQARRLTETGKEYEKTSERYPYGIRSTPTTIINNRLVIGTLPTAQMRAIFQALVERQDGRAGQRFLENWVP